MDYVFINEVEPSTNVDATFDLGQQETMQNEMESIQKNGIWQLVDLPESKRLITNKWICKIKLRASGHMEELKVWLVAHNFEQNNGMDTFVPILKWGTIQSIVALAT